MSLKKQLRRGQFLIEGYGQSMADGRWGAACLITFDLGDAIDEMPLPKDGPYFDTEGEAAEAGLGKGVDWLNLHFPV